MHKKIGGQIRHSVCALLLVATFLLLPSACRRPSDDALLHHAWQLCEALQHEKALPLIRAVALRQPRNPVAHYLLGKYYQHRERPALTLAKGQFDMARFLFDAEGDLSILTEMMTESEFQSTLHCDTALVLLRTTVEAEEAGLPRNAAIPILRKALDHARKGVYFNPNSLFLLDLVHTLDGLLRDLVPPEEPETPALPPLPQGRYFT